MYESTNAVIASRRHASSPARVATFVLALSASTTLALLDGAPAYAQQRNWQGASGVTGTWSGRSTGNWHGSQLPNNPTVVSGSVTFSRSGRTLDVTETSNSAIINWGSFSVGQAGSVVFIQPGSSSSILNNVTGSSASWIGGTIVANGQIFIVNQNGVVIGKGAKIQAGSFLASTLGISNSDFLAGRYNFSGNGASAGIINSGHISVSDGGFAALLGGQINNRGVIAARLGKVALGAGELVTLDFSGDGFLSVAVPSSQLGNLVSANGALVTNKGKILANGGTVYLSAATASNILREAVNIPGSIRVNTVGTHDGKIVLNGGPGGHISVSGTLLANGGRKNKAGSIAISGQSVDIKGKVAANGSSGGAISVASTGNLTLSGTVAAKGFDGSGGRIDLTGADVNLVGALINATGSNAGGLVRIGGTFQGGNGDPSSPLYQSFIGRFGALPNVASATTVTVDADTSIDVSATSKGDAGSVIVWSQQTTSFAGAIFATGGAAGGNGGYAEVSGKDHLELSGAFKLGAAQGATGTLLADPGSIVIQSGGNTYANADTFNDGYVSALLASANVILDTTYATGANGASGDITLNSGAAISWSAATNLTLNAARNIIFQSGASINGSGGTVILNAGDAASGTGRVIFNGSGTQVSSGGGTSAYYNPATFGTADFPTGSVSGPLIAYMLVNNNGQLTAINNNLGGNYALATNLNFGTFNVCDFNCNGVTYLEPLGNFTGSLDGRNYTINFTVYSSSSVYQGLFTTIGSSGTVSNLDVTARLWSGSIIGGIAGSNNGKIINSYANTSAYYVKDPNNALSTGNIGTQTVGGLVGLNNGQITNSSATLSTFAGSSDGVGTNIGGLVGINSGTITGSSSFGGNLVPQGGNSNFNPQIQYQVGGLVGLNNGAITTSWSSATINDTGLGNISTFDGGLVGFNQGTISSSYATGTVNGGMVVGGFAGTNLGQITASFSTGSASANPGSGYSGEVGGFVGWNGIEAVGNSLEQLATASVTQSWTASHVSGTATPLLQGFARLDGATNSNNYFDTTATGQTTAAKNQNGVVCTCGATAITTANAYNSSSYSSAFFGTAMYMVNGYDRPLPTALRTSSIGANDALQSAIQLELVGSNLSGNYTLNRDIDLSIVQASTIWSSSAGFGPIGGLFAAYTGTFNGQGHAIKNIFINQPNVATNFVGLFGNVGSGGVVENVGVLGGSVTGVQVVGALVGSNSGTVLNDYATASVAAQNNVGGLVGSNVGSISSSYATGNVNGNLGNGSSATGGLVGYNLGAITDAYATGNVTGGTQSSGQTAGGIAGTNTGTITNVYATGTVTGIAGKIGALVGNNVEIVQTFPPPDFNEVDVTVNHVITNGYWNTDTMGSATGTGVGTLNGGGGMNLSTMQDLSNFQSNFAGFNFTTTWAPPNQAGQGGNATAYTPGLYGPSNIIWVAANSASRIYGNSNPSLTYTLYGERTGDGPWIIAGLTLSAAATVTSNVGSYTISDGAPTATGANGVAYRFVNTGTLTVTQRGLSGSATITGIDKPYDGNTSASGGSASLTAANGVVNGDTVTLSATSGTYADANVVGVETITLNSVTLNNSNYSLGSLNYSGTGQINPKLVSLSLTGTVEKTYDGTNAATLTSSNYSALSGVLAGDVSSVSVNNPTTGTYSDANASALLKTVTVTGLQLSGGKANDYSITSTVSGTVGKIDTRPLSGNTTITAIDKVYDATTAASGGTASLTTSANNVVSGDVVTISAAAGTYTSANAGPQQNVAVTSVNIGNSNYSLGTLIFLGTGTISPRPLNGSASITGIDKTYDGNTTSLGGSVGLTALNNLVGGDSVTYSFTSGTYDSANAGAHTVTPSGVSLNNSNYSLGTLSVSISGTINPRAITVTADPSQTRVYGDANPTFTYTVGGQGLVTGESLTGALGTTATLVSPVGVGLYPITQGSVTNANNPNYSITYFGDNLSITPRPLNGIATIIGINKTYDANTTAGAGQRILLSGANNIVNGDTVTISVTGGTYDSANAGARTIATGTLTGLAQNNSNYSLGSIQISGAGTIAQRQLTITAATNTKTYDTTTTAAATPNVSGLQGSDTVTGLTEIYNNANVGTNKTLSVATYIVNDGNGGNNYTVQTVANLTGVINSATLTYLADPASRLTGAPNPIFTGTVTGFLGSDTIANATTGTLLFTSPALPASPPGQYPINGSGLTAQNYVFVQALSNATALTITVPPPPPQTPPTNLFPHSNTGDTPTQHDVNITFQNTTPTFVPVSFKPGGTGGIVTGALTDATGTGNNGHNYQPISQYDANQYSQFKLPGYQDDAGEATIFTIIARAAAADHQSDYMIDGFWIGTGADWNGANGKNPLTGKVTFSDGAGHDVTPNDANGFPIDQGKTDIAVLLQSGPVMIGGTPGQKPAEWLLATGLTADGKGIVCDDPITGKLVELAYDATNKSVGGVLGFYDPKSKGVVSFADASNSVPATPGGGGLATLQGFVPSTFFAVTVK